MSEAIRLVIWDLDETFWKGTLTEGGIQSYIIENHNVVVTLARRGIISSICSKNSFADIEAILREKGLWDYFVFPSIDWTPKGPRVARIIERMQLRAPTVLFIDDNALNRAEALDQAPGLQVADEFIISNILTDPRFQGKDDHGLTRLRQYQLLQTRAADQESAKGDNVAFLRASNIKVDIIYDVAAHIDPAVELVNRTIQLNFTKKRLSEDTEEARQQLLTALQPFYVWSGLVRVRDRYGDYGIVGFYMGGGFREKRRLTHFCFSCRTLGMGIERWVYDQIGRPELHVVGEVLTNLSDDVVVDWINASDAAGGESPGTSKLFDTKVRLRLRGGCDLDAVAHYAGTEGYTLTSEVNFGWHGLIVRHDNSSNLVLSLLAGDAQRQALKELDLDQLFRTATFDRCGQRTLTVLSMWSDRLSWRWRHRRLGFTITLDVPRLDLFALHRTLRKDPATDLTPFFLKQNIDQTHFGFLDRLIRRLSLDFDADNSLDEATYKDKLHTIFN